MIGRFYGTRLTNALSYWDEKTSLFRLMVWLDGTNKRHISVNKSIDNWIEANTHVFSGVPLTADKAEVQMGPPDSDISVTIVQPRSCAPFVLEFPNHRDEGRG